ncbi:MAG: rhodanese-like domain-containing protein, partial [Bacillota bacterium]
MKRLLILAIVTFLLLSIAGCAGKNASSGDSVSGDRVQSLSVEELKKQTDAGIDKNTEIIDLRESFLYAAGHIPGATHIPFADIERQYTQLDKNKKIILVCHTGPMGEIAGQFLLTKGFTQVFNLEGGMKAWDS